MLQKISIGRIVHAVVKDLAGNLITRPAIITRTWGDSPCVQATVFPDATNDGLGLTLARSSLRFDERGTFEDTWHWPAVELPMAAELRSAPAVDWVGLVLEASGLCADIESLPASGQATNLSIKASHLVQRIRQLATPQS